MPRDLTGTVERDGDTPSLARLAAYFLRLGALGSGGPIVDIPAALVAGATLATITWLRKLPEPIVILAAGGIGLALWSAR